MYWSSEWSTYILDDENGEIERALFEVYFRLRTTPQMFTWGKSSRRTLSLINKKEISYEDYFSGEMFELRSCSECAMITPHHIHSINRASCYCCKQNGEERDLFFERDLVDFAQIINGDSTLQEGDRRNLDASLYMICAFRKFEQGRFMEDAVQTVNHQTKAINRLAQTFSLWYLERAVRHGHYMVKVGDAGKETHKWNLNINKWNFQSWNALVNDSFRVFEKYDLVKPEGKGWRTVFPERLVKLSKDK